jgi:hypothetical protein
MSLDWQGRPCPVCGAALSRSLLPITVPDRVELALGMGSVDYEREWVECANCGRVGNMHLAPNLDRLESLLAAYYEVDFQSSSIDGKYTQVMAIPHARGILQCRCRCRDSVDIDSPEDLTLANLLLSTDCVKV